MMLLEPVVLAGRHVRLEPLALAHASALLSAANESRKTFALTIVPPDIAAMESYIATALADQSAKRALPFVVRDASGTVIGSTRFHDLEFWIWNTPPAEPVPSGPDAVEIGYTWYAERAQRTAINTEAKLLLCTHAFEAWRVRRVTWKTDARNARSRAAILRIGAQFEGILRAHRPAHDGLVRNAAFYSMLASEWPDAKRRLEDRLAIGSDASSPMMPGQLGS
jgi:RimJ/RimL family protein N-acetyltransferase